MLSELQQDALQSEEVSLNSNKNSTLNSGTKKGNKNKDDNHFEPMGGN